MSDRSEHTDKTVTEGIACGTGRTYSLTLALQIYRHL
jgi:hypothetical protein